MYTLAMMYGQEDRAERANAYQESYQAALSWIRRNRHLQESRLARDNPDYFDAICRGAAGAVALINAQDKQALPDSSLYDAFRGQGRQRPDQYRASFSISISDLRKATGIRDLPNVPDLREPDSDADFPFINIIWSRDNNSDSLKGEKIGADNFITAFSSILRDQVQSSLSRENNWKRFGQESDWRDLADQVLKRMREKQQ